MSKKISNAFSKLASVQSKGQMRLITLEILTEAKSELQKAIDKNDSNAGLRVVKQVQDFTKDFMSDPKLYMRDGSDMWIDTLGVLGNVSTAIAYDARRAWPDHEVWKQQKDMLEQLKALGKNAAKKGR